MNLILIMTLMFPAIESQANEAWLLEDVEFIDMNTDETVNMKVLRKESEEDIMQIFQMKDGKFILEIVNEEFMCDYFYSDTIDPLYDYQG